MKNHLSRRTILQGTGAILGSLLVPTLAQGAVKKRTHPSHSSPWPTSTWLGEENEHLGDVSWLHGPAAQPGTLEGYASATSVNLGDDIDFFVSSISPTFDAKVFRMGYYQGLGARLIETLHSIKGNLNTMPTPDEDNTVDCDWPVSFTVSTKGQYLPGQYLVRLELPTGEYQYIPFLIRHDASNSAFVYMSSVTTWQAYNAWGGFSLYRGSDPWGNTDFNGGVRAVRVSFNRPYSRFFANGAGDFIGNEFPLLFLCEQMGLDMTYWTDLDLHQRGDLLTNHRALLSLGHDEYYSPEMRDAVTTGVASGVNVAFFGANFCYRKIRFEPSYNGDDRLMVNYRSTTDPIMATDPSLATVNWSQWPSDEPECTFSGSIWGGVNGSGSLVVEDSSSWLWSGAGLTDGDVLTSALGGEFNHFNPLQTNPANVQIFGHSPVVAGTSDVTYVAEPGQGGVFCSGTGQWIYHLSNAPRLETNLLLSSSPNFTAPLTTATKNVLALFGKGPAGVSSPSVSNTSLFY